MTSIEQCPLCGGTTTEVTHRLSRMVGAREFQGSIGAWKCDACGEIAIASDALHVFEIEIANRISRSSEASPEGFKFMRSLMGLKSKEVALLFDVKPETVSRWENDARGVDGPWRLMATMLQQHIKGEVNIREHLAAMSPLASTVELGKVA